MANKEEKADEKQSSWKDFFYNPRTGEFIGRTASSWGHATLKMCFTHPRSILGVYDFLLSDESSRSYIKHYPGYSKLYHCSQWANEPCPEGMYFEQDDVVEKKVCQFKRSVLRQCSGLADSNFGYSEGQPCILVKMNRVIGLRPRGDPHINCIAKVIPKSHFVLLANYVQPVVAVKLLLTEDDYNSELVIECKVEGSDLLNSDDRDKFLGRVTFRVEVSK
uniref:Sodium/potassium-transporting ATPase subunit beta-3 n=1 Tax=Sinocyclocheilus grahami TaxID=75366 RepID=A0A672L5M6_SINGR